MSPTVNIVGNSAGDRLAELIDTLRHRPVATTAAQMREASVALTKLREMLDRSRSALLHGTPEQRGNMATFITDYLDELRR